MVRSGRSGGVGSIRSAIGSSGISASVGLLFVIVPWLARLLRLVRIKDWSRDYVSIAGPLSEIDQPAPLGAEREIRFRAQHQLPTGGTAQAGDAFMLRHFNFSFAAVSLSRA
jgi:hypothetical protein